MKKSIRLVVVSLAVAVASIFAVSCTEEFEVQENLLYNKWQFPESMSLVDTITGFNYSGAVMTILPPDTIRVSAESTRIYKWTLRGNSITATCTPRANVDEHYILAFTIYEQSASQMKIKGKARYIYDGENTERGNISCTLTKYVPPTPASK